MVVGEFGAQLPMADRIGIYQAVYDEVLDAATDGLPAAGAHTPHNPTLQKHAPVCTLTPTLASCMSGVDAHASPA